MQWKMSAPYSIQIVKQGFAVLIAKRILPDQSGAFMVCNEALLLPCNRINGK
jgi:hypothetical protein